ncbi:protein-arginine deiminase (PAD) domain-containing protein [Hirsutella rhossiliensis]|uniref:Protein-arginine deiminase (PAD) domain-containing protein n=1 Tax=Hirsutella rhossiliensis TaxID=111463 RepID=A0A9P8SHY4_9HYPO|nr:protein-arginine deiminase (PAD) domain-containing protein [Hirsutella rhossiliensis]KAH0963286.1 protein-arginine deiminase (PAD) domain-containing protein [Hirsutella rhossiliensis]
MKYWYSLVFASSAALVCALPQDTGSGAGDSPSVSEPFNVDIRADTNRDGKVDMEGTTDIEGKDTWTDERGALFLANIADPSGRCLTSSVKNDLESTKKLLNELPRPHWTNTPEEKELAGCHDASDDVQRAPQNMATIRTLPVKGLGASASGAISVSDDAARDLVRVFRPIGDSWEIVKSDTTFSAEDLAKGLELGVDARDTRRPNVQQAVAEIQKVLSEAQIHNPIITLDTLDPWAQDIFEPAYTSMPGPDGTVAIQILVDSAIIRDGGSNTFTYTSSRDFGVGTVQYYGRGNGQATLDSMGNIETIPPYEHKGKKYPAGRIVTGGDEATGNVAFITDFYRAQEVQSPLILDSTWLMVKHVDEFVQFLPVDTERRWCVMINDPKAGFELVKQAQKNGAGGDPVISKPEGVRQSIDSFLATDINTQARDIAAERIQKTIDVLKEETGVTDAEIFRVPALVSTYRITHAQTNFQESKLRRRQDNDSTIEEPEDPGNDIVMDTQLEAVVNGLVVNNSTYICPKPWGPVVNGKSIFEEAVQKVYGDLGYTVKFVDDWLFHQASGDLHCATNTLREASASWWGQDSIQQNGVSTNPAGAPQQPQSSGSATQQAP